MATYKAENVQRKSDKVPTPKRGEFFLVHPFEDDDIAIVSMEGLLYNDGSFLSFKSQGARYWLDDMRLALGAKITFEEI